MLKFSIGVVLSFPVIDAYIHVVFVGSTEVYNFMSFLSKNIFRDEGLPVGRLCLLRKSCYMYSYALYNDFD